jgi:hypothetical protein
MKSKLIPALTILVVLGYLGFEVSALYQARERMDAVSIFDSFVKAGRAHAACGVPDARQRGHFEASLDQATGRAVRKLAERNPGLDAAGLARLIGERRRAREAETDALIAAAGCAGREVAMLVRQYAIWARYHRG